MACQSSSPPDNSYTVQVCLNTPGDGSSLTGDTTTTATATVTSGTDPGMRKMVFYLDGNYLLTDYQAPYTFTLPTAKFVDGAHTLSVEAWMRPTLGGFVTPQSSINLTFNNGVTVPPVNNNTFKVRTGTTPAPNAPFVVAAAGDGAGGEQGESDTTNLIASWMPNLFLYLGDVYEQGSPTEFYNWYRPQAQAGSMYGRFNSITDPTVGNHEYNAGVATGYFDYWDNVPHYYSYNVHGWHMISIDANSAFNQTQPGTAQYTWLQNDLNAVDATTAVTVGKSTAGASTTTFAPNTKYANPVSLGVAGTVSKLSAYVDGSGGASGGGTTQVVGAIYADASGSPGALQATSAPVTILKNQVRGWVDLTFSQPVSLNAGNYWLALLDGGTANRARLYGDASTGASRTNTDAYSDGPSNPFGSATTGNTAYSLNATYVPTNQHPCILAYWHQPLYNIGQEGYSTYMSSIWSLLAQHGAALVVNGHDHTYQRFVPLDGSGNPSPTGVTEIVAGTGGHALGSFITTDSRLASSVSGTFGALRLELNSAGAGYQYVSDAGSVLDSGSVACSPLVADTQPPSAPTGLTANPSYKTRIDLSWNESTDNVGVTGYEIYRDGSLIATVPQTTYSDKGVLAGTTHTYTVRAKDGATPTNFSPMSNSATATTPATGVLFSDGFEGSSHFGNWVNPAVLAGGFPQNNGLAAEQSQVLNGSWAAEANSTGLGAAAWRALPETANELYAQVHFKVQSQSTSVNLLRFRNDLAGANALATAFVSGTNRIGIRDDITGVATSSTSAAGVASPGSWHTLQVHINVNGTSSQLDVWLDGNPIPELSLSGIDLGTDPIGNLELGDPNSTTNPKSFDVFFDDFAYDYYPIVDASAPTAPVYLTANAKSGLEVDMSWLAASDDIGVTGYDIYRDGTLIDSVGGSTLSYQDQTVSPQSTYAYTVVARDAAGNSSPASNSVSVTTGHAFSDGFESGGLSPKWSTVNGLNVQQAVVDSGSYAAEATSSGASAASAQAVLDRTVPELYYRVRFQLLSQGANTVSLIRFRNGLVGANPIGSVFISSTGKLGFRNDVAATQVTATTTSVIPSVWHELQLHVNVATGAVDVWLDGAPVAALSGLTQSLGANNIGRLELGDPTASARTYDVAFDNVIADTTQIPSDAVPDSTPPTAPGNLRSTAATPSEVDLAWDAATDDVGVTGYRIYRGGAQVASVDGSTLSYADTTVSPSTDYTYTVTAVDGVGQESPASNSLPVSTPAPPDTTPPTKPTGLTTSGTGSQINLSWNASTDNVGVTGYNIYRNGSLLTSVGGSTLTYADSTVSPGTFYNYTVSAFDLVPNESLQSDPASVTTDVFSDGFESGNLSNWSPVAGLITQTTNADHGIYAAEAKSAQTNAAYAVKTLPNGPYADVYYNVNLKILSGKKDTVDVLRFRNPTGGNLLSLLYDPNRRLAYHNDTNGQTTTSTTTLNTGVWYAVKVHLLLNGSSSQIEVWLNGTKVTALSRTDSFPAGSTTGQIVAGESSTGHGYDYALDDVLVKKVP